jgi:hypothetical protein
MTDAKFAKLLLSDITCDDCFYKLKLVNIGANSAALAYEFNQTAKTIGAHCRIIGLVEFKSDKVPYETYIFRSKRLCKQWKRRK